VPDELGVATFDGLAPGEYVVIATADPPPTVVQYPGGQVLIDRTPATLELVLRARARGELVEVPAGGRVLISLGSGLD